MLEEVLIGTKTLIAQIFYNFILLQIKQAWKSFSDYDLAINWKMLRELVKIGLNKQYFLKNFLELGFCDKIQSDHGVKEGAFF